MKPSDRKKLNKCIDILSTTDLGLAMDMGRHQVQNGRR